MRSDHLCDAGWSYDLLHEVEGADRRDGRLYGQGTGTLRGAAFRHGALVETPAAASALAVPNACGVIHPDGGGVVLSELRGLSSLHDGSGVHVMTFEAAAPERCG